MWPAMQTRPDIAYAVSKSFPEITTATSPQHVTSNFRPSGFPALCRSLEEGRGPLAKIPARPRAHGTQIPES